MPKPKLTTTPNFEKLQRLRHRRHMMGNEVKLLSDDIREHESALREATSHLARITAPHRPVRSEERPRNDDYSPNGLQQWNWDIPIDKADPAWVKAVQKAEARIAEIKSLKAKCSQMIEERRTQLEAVGRVVTKVERYIVEVLKVELPRDPRSASTGSRNMTGADSRLIAEGGRRS